MAPPPIDLFVGEAVAGRLESVSDVLDGAESISDVLDGVESILDVLGGAADVCVLLLAVVAVTTPTTPMSEIVYWPISSLIYVV